jgi:hypothetical protein
LTEFHGEFEDAKLPPRAKLFSGKGLDVMQSKKQPFEDYLRCLLQKPSLKGSDILYTFLKSTDEFTAAGTSNLGLGKMIKNVPMKLTKDRGQGLQPFITTFVASTLSGPPKPRYDSVVNSADYDMSTERPILPHPLYQDNLGIQQPSSGGIHLGHCNKYYSGMKETSESGIFDTIVYLGKSALFLSLFFSLFYHPFKPSTSSKFPSRGYKCYLASEFFYETPSTPLSTTPSPPNSSPCSLWAEWHGFASCSKVNTYIQNSPSVVNWLRTGQSPHPQKNEEKQPKKTKPLCKKLKEAVLFHLNELS